MPEGDQKYTHLDDDDVSFLSTQLRGIRKARVRFVGALPAFEMELVELLLALGVSLTTERLAHIAPYPNRRFGINYKGQMAIITAAPDAQLMG